MASARDCDCPHGFPLCACREGLTGRALLDRSRVLSSLAGWPARVDPALAAEILAGLTATAKPRIPLVTPHAPKPGGG